MTGKQPSSTIMGGTYVEDQKAKDAQSCYDDLREYFLKQLSPAKELLASWWIEEKIPKSQNKQKILDKFNELERLFEKEVDEKVHGFEKTHSKDLRLQHGVNALKWAMHEVTTNIDRPLVEGGIIYSLGTIRFLTLEELRELEWQWLQRKSLQDYDLI